MGNDDRLSLSWWARNAQFFSLLAAGGLYSIYLTIWLVGIGNDVTEMKRADPMGLRHEITALQATLIERDKRIAAIEQQGSQGAALADSRIQTQIEVIKANDERLREEMATIRRMLEKHMDNDKSR